MASVEEVSNENLTTKDGDDEQMDEEDKWKTSFEDADVDWPSDDTDESNLVEDKAEDNNQAIDNKSEDELPPPEPKKQNNFVYGPMPNFPNQRIWSHIVILIGVIVYVCFTYKQDRIKTFAKKDEIIVKREYTVKCDPKYTDEMDHFPYCKPRKCGRYVYDNVLPLEDVDYLRQLIDEGIRNVESDGSVAILDLHKVPLSLNKAFTYLYFQIPNFRDVYVDYYTVLIRKIQNLVADTFDIHPSVLTNIYPTYFIKLTNAEPETVENEYWHVHVDKEIHESSHYTALLYLNNYENDFDGGRLMFVGGKYNLTVEPKKARLVTFSSGAENPYFVERVKVGGQYALTVSFTCNVSVADEKYTVKQDVGYEYQNLDV